MLTTLAAALSLAASLAVDVPYLPQTDALCGGAATAMVFRYWGDAHAGIQQFAPLVDRDAGRIADDVLTAAVAARGWSVTRFDGTIARLREQIAAKQPIVVLLADRRDRYHYVVVVGATPASSETVLTNAAEPHHWIESVPAGTHFARVHAHNWCGTSASSQPIAFTVS